LLEQQPALSIEDQRRDTGPDAEGALDVGLDPDAVLGSRHTTGRGHVMPR
jgi:hypothetical protein